MEAGSQSWHGEGCQQGEARGGWTEGPGAGAVFQHPPEAVAGNRDTGKRWRGQQHPHAYGTWSHPRGASLSGLCTPTAASLHARIALHCRGQVRHRAFLRLPLLSLISGPRASLPTGAFGRQGCAFTAAPSSPQGRTWPLRLLGGGRQSSAEQKSVLIIK